MKLASFLDPRRMAVGQQVTSRQNLLKTLVGLLERSGVSLDALHVTSVLEKREAKCSTGIGQGLAVPHAAIEGLESTVLSVVSLARPMDFDAVDGKPIRLAILVLSPPSRTEEHLGLLARIARIFSRVELMDRLAETTSVEELCGRLIEEDERHIG